MAMNPWGGHCSTQNMSGGNGDGMVVFMGVVICGEGVGGIDGSDDVGIFLRQDDYLKVRQNSFLGCFTTGCSLVCPHVWHELKRVLCLIHFPEGFPVP